MKKICLSMMFLLSVTGCQGTVLWGDKDLTVEEPIHQETSEPEPKPVRLYTTVDVSWMQEGKDCVYQEINGELWQVWNPEKKKKENKQYFSSVKTLKYGNTSCGKVIDAELTRGTYKSKLENNFH